MPLLAVHFPALSVAAAQAEEEQLPILGDAVSGVISLEQERRLGESFLRSLRRSAPTVDDPLLKGFVEHLTYRLASYSDLQDKRLSLIIIDSAELNAFAAPGGVVGINLGLFRHGETQHEFASILAHELAHLSQRHFARRVDASREAMVTNMLGLLTSVLVIAAGGPTDAALATLTTGQALAQQQQLAYSRQREAEADRIGIKTLAAAGLDPLAMAHMFERLARANRYAGRELPEFLRSHPVTQARISDSYNRARELRDDRIREISLDYQIARVRARRLMAKDARRFLAEMRDLVKAGDPALVTAGQYGVALAYLDLDQGDSARIELGQLLERHPTRIAFQIAMAEAALRNGNGDAAVVRLSRQLRLAPDNFPLSMALADTYLKLEQPKQATAVLEPLGQQRPHDSDVWYLLAEAYGLADDIPALHQARAEFFILHGDFEQAIKQLRFALPLLEDNFQQQARIRQRIRDIDALREDEL